MQTLQRLRNAHLLARFVLVWFVLFVGVAAASPIVSPKAMEFVCSGTGVMKLITQGDDTATSQPKGHSTLDCPMCANLGTALVTPLVVAPLVFSPPFYGLGPVSLAPAVQPLEAWQARAPPASI